MTTTQPEAGGYEQPVFLAVLAASALFEWG